MNSKTKTSLMLRVFEIADFIPSVGKVIQEIPLVFDLGLLKIHQHFFPEPVQGGIVIQAYNQQGELLFIPGVVKKVTVKTEDGNEVIAEAFFQSVQYAPINISRILSNIDTKKLIQAVAKYNEIGTNPPLAQFLGEILKDGTVISDYGQLIDTSKMLS